MPQAEPLVRHFYEDLRAWRETAQEQLRRWADDPETAVTPGVDMKERLAARMAALDARIEEIQRRAEALGLQQVAGSVGHRSRAPAHLQVPSAPLQRLGIAPQQEERRAALRQPLRIARELDVKTVRRCP